MKSQSNAILITTLAEYQTLFWISVGFKLRDAGNDVVFISFDDRSTEIIDQAGFRSFCASDVESNLVSQGEKDFETVISHFCIQDINYWFSHEKMAFAIYDEASLKRKFAIYMLLADRACSELLKRGSVVMVQELGGFISVIASFFAARHHNIDNWFVEPSFFRGRVFFIRNSFAALRVREMADMPSPQVKTYIENTLKNCSIVVPRKDSHQYRSSIRKVVNLYNIKRLFQKIIGKYILGKHYEFGHVAHHVTIHLKMIVNNLVLHRHYKKLPELGSFVYYPLHVPGDMALTLRSPQYLDQLGLIDYMARIVPHTHKIAIKEHPAMVGAINIGGLLKLLRCRSNVVILDPSINNYEVMRHADAIVSVNSKSGAEATLLGKPVLVLGDAFYTDSNLVTKVSNVVDLPLALEKVLIDNPCSHDLENVHRYFEAVWRHTYPGELYVCEASNCDIFSSSLMEAIRQFADHAN